jgi:hypothetical protein
MILTYVYNPAVTPSMVEDDPWLSNTPDLWGSFQMGADVGEFADAFPWLIVFEVER